MKTMNSGMQHSELNCTERRYFYCVTSEQVVTEYLPRSTRGPHVFQAQIGYCWSQVTKGAIEHHLSSFDRRATPFVSTFDDFADALKWAYHFYLRGDERICIVQIDAADLVRSDGIEEDTNALIPIWCGLSKGADEWLSMAEIAPALDIHPRLIQKSEWLACGQILKWRLSAAWPVIEGRLFFEQGRGEDLVDLFTYCCGRMPDYFRQQSDSSRYTYDWDDEVFLETESHDNEGSSLPQNGLSTSRVGLSVASRFTMFGYAGFLRGMKVVD